jgi:formylglycine-generating enzyme required for sulfatase activity
MRKRSLIRKNKVIVLAIGIMATVAGSISLSWAFQDIPKSGQVWHEPAMGMAFVWVPKGCFQMGSPAVEAGRDPDESPLHQVCLEGFWMGKTEVTNAQYRQFKTNHVIGKHRGFSMNGKDQPAVYINWHDAKAFAKWLTGQNKGRYGFRLPTEAEWEYACRAETRTARFWGDDPDKACEYANVADLTAKREWSYWEVNNCEDGYVVTAPVGSFKPNAFGLYDMLGNVFEWSEDVYSKDAYRHHQRNNPINTGGGSYQVIRGGCWYSWPAGVRCAGRSDHPPAGRNRDYFLGFRLVRTP